MTVYIDKKYMILPSSKHASLKRVYLYENGKLLFDFVCKIDNISPDFTAYVDVSAFIGKSVTLKIEPDVHYTPKLSNIFPGPEVYAERFRPKVHFTVKNGWNNDPNGLIRKDGVYHMFYQYNPAGAEWGNMHWGHAVSRDLLHWEEKDIALFPDELGTMFSGSAITDSCNASGLGKDAMLLFYTAAGGTNVLSQGKPFTQCLAYSLDNGATFQKYEHNPIVAHIAGSNRDPKVIYVEELGRYVMALFLKENEYALLTSADLISWEELQRITLPGDAECPDIFRLECDGIGYYVIMGALDKYTVGRFTNGRFTAEGAAKSLTYLKMSYAAQSFSGTEAGRVVRISWNIINSPADSFTSQMGFPVEMKLKRQDGELFLSCLPIREIEQLYISSENSNGVKLDSDVVYELGTGAADISISCKYTFGEKLKLTLFGSEIICDMELNEIRCKRAKMPLSLFRDRLDLRIIADTSSIELYCDGGKSFLAVSVPADHNLPYIKIDKNEALSLDTVEVHKLKGVYDAE